MCDANGKDEIVKITEDVHVQEHYDESKTIGDIRYLPLKVWRRKGFPWRNIKATGEKVVCPNMGTVYGAIVRTKRNE